MLLPNADIDHQLSPSDFETKDTLYVYEFAKLKNLYKKWVTLMPTIIPYYAIKCNPDPYMLSCLADMGACFDAASPAEMAAALDLVPPSRIIYANPCKPINDISTACKSGISLTVFDNIQEYEKIIEGEGGIEEMCMLFRIYASDPSAKCVLSNKYGATMDEWRSILEGVHQRGGLNRIKGVSFHIGSGANDPSAFSQAIDMAKIVFDMATDMGFTMSILDIGGGFTYTNIEKMATCVNRAVADFQAIYPDTTVIAEPGRYFAESIANLYTKIIGVRARANERQYWINDSIYGSFNNIVYDHARPIPIPMVLHGQPQVSSVIWGSTCDGADKILESVQLPILSLNDWLRWDNMGAYTQAGASHFNGIPFADTPKIYI